MQMRRCCLVLGLLAAVVLAGELTSGAGLGAADAVKVRNLKMRRTDRPDTTDLDSILATILTPGMSDEQKAKAIWKFCVSMRHQDAPPTEMIAAYPADGVKMFNVYGYNFCSMVALAMGELGERAGLPTRQRGIHNHNVMEFYYGGAWHMYDASLISYYYDTDLTIVASVDTIIAKAGSLINQAHNPYLDSNGWFPALTHNIAAAQSEYDGSANYVLTDGVGSGFKIGYRCLLNLREGETLVRSCANTGNKHVNQYGAGGVPGCLNQTPLTGGDMGYINSPMPTAEFPSTWYFHQNYLGGIIGNGSLSWTPDLAGGAWAHGVESATNLACTQDDTLTPALHPAAVGAASMVYRMQSPYIFLEGSIQAQFYRADAAQSATVSISTNNGLDWQNVYTLTGTGSVTANIDISSRICRRYDYLVKIDFSSAGAKNNVGLNGLTTTNLIQHHQRALPFLVAGTNNLLIEGGGDTQTVTVTGQLTPDGTFTSNETQATEHAALVNCNVVDNYCWMVDGASPGSITWPVTVKGDISAVRFGGCFRVNNAGQKANLQISTTSATAGFTTVDSVTGPTRMTNKYVTYSGVPAGVRTVWVRFEFVGTDTIGVMGQYRIDVDYHEPNAQTAPFKIRHDWTDSTGAHSHTETITSLPHSYAITCGANAVTDKLTVQVDNPTPSGTAPTIVTPPTNQTVTAGQTATFTVAAGGTGPFTYVWKHGTTAVGGNAATLSIAGATAADAGSYTVTITNSFGSITSGAASLTVNPAPVAPTIATPPASLTVTAGQAATFTVAASGTAPLTYVWKRGSTVVGTNASTYSIGSATVGDAGSYTVTVSNAAGSVTSAAATLTVNVPANPVTCNVPSLTIAAPAGATTAVNTTLTLTNNSGAAITVSLTDGSVWLSAAAPGGGGSATIAAGATVTFTITADPTGVTGTVNGLLTITNTPGGATQTIPVAFTVSGSGPGGGPVKKGGCAVAAGSAGDFGSMWAMLGLGAAALGWWSRRAGARIH